MKVLLLEDEKSIRDFVRINLKREGCDVIEAASGEEALTIADSQPNIEIAILDVMLPGIDGFEVCGQLRRKFPRMGIIMLTAKSQELDKVMGLEFGADDYVVKPFSPAELLARVKALHRRLTALEVQEEDSRIIDIPPFQLLLDERKLIKHKQEIDLTPKEFAIIKLLAENANKAISRDDILTEVWGQFYIGDLKVVDVNIRRIRQKIEDDPAHPAYVETVWGYGYLWRKETADEGN
ncbi:MULTISPECIES: response regulator transcription factor [Brevibacillus]|jgi:DNA-binding response OmpR family regulator|uniref:Two-component response regulator n=1 Tax=Brevibacillus borstelensis AK1 TaxID=1300222 RepID=M8DWN8_9BACL|nr:response regulator transcription factor [Brevibacillus borstelensis]EMT51431.1 two-component response regulator [Brevibacillus borstelensis AK1]KKX54952.1 chemotaxis protein CheY [Brevibacillus borstelensis cifa_chp40]MBE5396298.1 response regulator transcription factor [Brevibacillus borstelensis]MCC0564399.1 response regulator transcription factor [Brevibacillus borstelensis]MCM3473142.1 response regulator transcription factor [Brevibacillus borstelensis]